MPSPTTTNATTSSNATTITSPLARVSSSTEDLNYDDPALNPITAKPASKLSFHAKTVSSSSFEDVTGHPFQKKGRSDFEVEVAEDEDDVNDSNILNIISNIPNDSNISTLKRFRKYKENKDYKSWARDLESFCHRALEDEEMAGVCLGLLEELKGHLQRSWAVQRVSFGEDSQLNLYYAQALTVLGRLDDALRVLEDCNHSEASFLKACLLRATGNIPKAIEAFKAVLEAEPGHIDAHEHLHGFTCGLLASNELDNELTRLYATGQYERVVAACKDSIALLSDGELILLVSSLTMLKETSRLFALGQSLVEERPSQTLSWYTVGCFYLTVGKIDDARRFFFKAGLAGSKRVHWRLARRGCADVAIGPSWIALAHSFAAAGDHDQAVSAYVTATKTHVPGALEPLLFLAGEQLRVRQPALAGAYLLQAHGMAPTDARVINELSCLQLAKGNHLAALELISSISASGQEDEFGLIVAVNTVVIALKAANEIVPDLDALFVLLSKHIDQCKVLVSSPSSDHSLFPWNGPNPSPAYQCLHVAACLLEWQGREEEAGDLLTLLLECRNEHRFVPLEASLLERQHRLLGIQRVGVKNEIAQEPLHLKTPLIRSFSNGLRTGTPLSAASLSFSLANTSSSSLAASISRRRLSLRRQMTGLRFDISNGNLDASFDSSSLSFFESSMELE